ncbi:PAS domain S-box protein [Robiginitalea sediminis]|uniref:PAS domain S-box protein n=1 Tax=Robiginitalea sediminis TaxID=1982593 RepID=UPI000B4B8A42|nr:PAS domain S-box protein [Robiginitalea sediminis]
MGTLTKYRFSREVDHLSGHGLVLLDPKGCIVQMNGIAEELFGFMASEIRGRDLWSFIAEKPGQSRGGLNEALHILHTKEDGDIPVILRFSPLLETLEHQLVFVRPLKAVSDTDLRLKAQQTKLNALLEAIPDSIFIQDYQGNFLGYYPPVSGGLFEAGQKIQGQHMGELFPEALTGQFLEAFEGIRKDRRARHLEFSLNAGATHYEARLVPMNNHKILSIVREVTHAKEVQNILNLRNRALEAAGNGFVISDARAPDQPVSYINSAFTEITGYAAEEVLGRNCRFLQGSDRKQPGIAKIRKSLERNQPCSEVLRNYRKDGSLFWNELTLTPILDNSGEATHFIGVIRDVSERVNQVRRKDRIHRILEEITADKTLGEIAPLLCDLLLMPLGRGTVHMHLLHTQKKFLETLATRSDGIKGPKLPAEIPLDQCPYPEICDTVLKNCEIIRRIPDRNTQQNSFGKPQHQEGFRSLWTFPIRSSHQDVLGTFTLLLSAEGKPNKKQRENIREVLQLARVAIERYKSRERLQKSHNKLEAYARLLEERVADRTRRLEDTVSQLRRSNTSLEEQIEWTREAERKAMASHALFAAMARNFPKGVIMVFNPAMQLVHLEGEELETMGLSGWAFQDQNPSALPGFGEAQLVLLERQVTATLHGGHMSFELEHHGQTYNVNTTPLTFNDQIQWALLVFSNTTAQKQTQQELMRALRIEQELNDLKSRFISMASHEFRTPLSAILSSAILIEKQNDQGKESKRERYVNQIKNNVRNLVVILEDFLSLSRVEEGDIACQATSFDLLALLRSVLEELETSLKVGQYFVEHFSHGDHQVVLDPKLTRHILINLLSNAIKYSPENAPIHIDLDTDDHGVGLTIRDRGMGIPEEEQDQLFNRFFRARNAMNIPGTGLGLHIVKKYTELMCGDITFESTPGRGSSFRIRLPRKFKSVPDETHPDH